MDTSDTAATRLPIFQYIHDLGDMEAPKQLGSSFCSSNNSNESFESTSDSDNVSERSSDQRIVA